jgi:hypothetical protein
MYRALFFDLALIFPEHVHSFPSYFQSRLEAEGESFAYSCLPVMGKAIETSLITGDAFVSPGWKKKKGTQLPAVLYGLFREVWSADGQLLFTLENVWKAQNIDNTNLPIRFLKSEAWAGASRITGVCRAYWAIWFLRQIFLAYSKVETPCPESLRESAIQAFSARITAKHTIQSNKLTFVTSRLPLNESQRAALDVSEVLNEARRLIRHILEADCTEARELRDFERNPWGRHGPGAVAGREVGPEKWKFQKFPGIPDELFHSFGKSYLEVKISGERPCARVVDVPKDFRGPRIICVEPKEYQFAQQGIMDILYRLLHKHPSTSGAIDFRDTSKSISRCYDYSYATIDLKDASDRISLELARAIFPRWFYRLVTRYRSSHVEVGSRRLKVTCLATMGNATCFPLETLVFWAIARSVVNCVRDGWTFIKPPEPTEVLVFGDDIIVPSWSCEAVQSSLVDLGMVVNTSKTCNDTLVRESCGEWVYASHSCKIVRFRTPTVKDYRSWVGWHDLSSQIDHVVTPNFRAFVDRELKKFLPDSAIKRRRNKKLQRPEVRLPTIVTVGKEQELPGVSGLYAWHVRNDLTPFLKGARKLVKMRWMDARCLNYIG